VPPSNRRRTRRATRLPRAAVSFTHDYRPIADIRYPYERWRKTLLRLPLRYRKPCAARHTSVSWNPMLGKNPLWVARQHGHRIATMLSVYVAWVKGTRERDLAALRRAMGYEQQEPTRTIRARVHASTNGLS
jgi:integrase